MRIHSLAVTAAVLSLSAGLAATSPASAAKPRAPDMTPEALAQLCIKQGCWMPGIPGVTHVYACDGGETVRSRFDPANNRQELTRGEAAPIPLTEQRDPPGSRNFRFVAGGFVWFPDAGVATLTSDGARLACKLVRIEQGAQPSIMLLR